MDDVQSILSGPAHFVAFLIVAGLVVMTVRLMGGLSEAWSAIDISENIDKVRRDFKGTKGGLHSWVMAAAYGALAVLMGGLAWHFDISSSWDYSMGLRNLMMKTVGVASWGALIVAGITYSSTLLELFGARFARINIRFVQAAVIGASGFDLFTDRERVYEFFSPFYGTFVGKDNAWYLNIAFEALYYYLFGVWWLLASYGFEMLTIVFAFASIAMVLANFGSASGMSSDRGGGRSKSGRTERVYEAE